MNIDLLLVSAMDTFATSRTPYIVRKYSWNMKGTSAMKANLQPVVRDQARLVFLWSFFTAFFAIFLSTAVAGNDLTFLVVLAFLITVGISKLS